MAVTQKQLNGTIVPGTTATTLYTVPASTTATIQTITLCNTTSSTATVTIYRVPNGGTAGTGNVVISSYSIPANTTDVLNELRWVQGAGSSIQALQGTSNAINVFLDGVEVA